MKNQFILVILALERSLYRLPSPRNKLLPVSRIFPILCEKPIYSGHFGVRTKSVSFSVAKIQTTSGLSNFSDFMWKANLLWPFWRWQVVCIASRREETNYFRFVEYFRFYVKNQFIPVILALERSLYRIPTPRNKLLPVSRTFPTLCEKSIFSGHLGVGKKSVSLSVVEKQTTSGSSIFMWKINLFR